MFCLEPTDTSPVAMTLQAQEGTQRQPDVITLCAGSAHLRSFHAAKLLDAAMILFNHPREAREFNARPFAHRHIVGCPPLNVTVCGDYLEEANQPVAFQLHDAPARIRRNARNGAQARVVRVDEAVTFQACQPPPAEILECFQVFKARVPPIKHHARRSKAALPRRLYQHLEVVVLGQRILGFVKESVVNRDMSITIRPQRGDKVDTRNDGMVLARPVPSHQVNLVGKGFIQRRIVNDKDACGEFDLGAGFFPERRGIGFEPMKQARKGIVGGRRLSVRRNPCRFDTGACARRRNQKVDVFFVSDFWWIHSAFLHYRSSTA